MCRQLGLQHNTFDIKFAAVLSVKVHCAVVPMPTGFFLTQSMSRSAALQSRKHPLYPVLHDRLATAGALPQHLRPLLALCLRGSNLRTVRCRRLLCSFPLSALSFLQARQQSNQSTSRPLLKTLLHTAWSQELYDSQLHPTTLQNRQMKGGTSLHQTFNKMVV